MEPSNSLEGSNDARPPTTPLLWYRNHRVLWWVGGIGSGFILALLLVVFVFPAPLARHMIASELEKMGIASAGIETVQLDLWNSEIKVGPLKLWSQDSDPGQVQSAALVYDLNNLFHKELLVEALVVEGVDIVILRDEEGAYTINGVSPAQILERTGTPEASEEDSDDEWVAGVVDLKVRNSHLLLQDYTGGTLALEIEELVLKDLSTWAPNEGGELEAKMALNDIGLEFQGEIRPFADPIALSFHGGLRDATLAKVSKFTGPLLGLTRHEAVLDSEFERDIFIHSDGRIETASVETILVTGVDLLSDDSNQVQLAKAEIKFDASSTIYPDDAFEYAGTIEGTLDELNIQSANGSRGGATKIDLAIKDFSAAQRGERRAPSGMVVADEIVPSQADGVAPSLISQIVLIVVDAVREILTHDLEFEASPSATIEGINISLAAEDSGPSLELNTATLVASAPGVRASTVDAGWRIDGALNGSVAEIDSTVKQDGVTVKTAVQLIDLAAPRIGAETGETETVFSFDVRAKFEDFITSNSMADSPETFEVAFGALEANTSGFEVRSNPEGERATGPIDMTVDAVRTKVRRADSATEVKASGVVIALPSLAMESSAAGRGMKLSGHTEVHSLAASRTGAGSDPGLRIGATSWKTDISELNLDTRDDGVVLGGQFDATLSAIEAHYGPGAVSVGSWETAIGKLTINTRNDALVLAGELTTNLTEIETDVIVDSAPLGLALGQLRANLTSLDVESRADDLLLDLTGDTTWRALDLSLAATDARAGGNAELGLSNLDIREFVFSGGATPTWRALIDVELKDMKAVTSDEALFSLGLGGVDAKGVESDQNGQVSIDEADFSALSIDVTDQAIAILTGDGIAEDTEAQPPSKNKDALPGLRIGRLAVAEGSRVQFTDTSVEPIARFLATVKKAEVKNFDTKAPSEKTKIEFQAKLNELSEISLSGWMAPLKEPLGFDVVGQVNDVALPDFSPYIAKFSGVNVETGQLTSNLSALTDAGDLEGKLDVLISELDLSSASDETSEKFQVDYGVPIELAVGLLEDNEGKIALEFPIGGKVGSPEIDYSDAIKAAIRGVLTAFFPSFDFGMEADGVRLDPIVFSAGTSELDDVGRGLTQQIAKLLNEKPNLSIKVCGKATAADFLEMKSSSDKVIEPSESPTDADPRPDAWTSTVDKHIAIDELTLSDVEAESLLGIAIERTSVARRYLIEDEGISEDRVGQCRHTYSMKDKRPPRVDVRF